MLEWKTVTKSMVTTTSHTTKSSMSNSAIVLRKAGGYQRHIRYIYAVLSRLLSALALLTSSFIF